MSQTVSVIVPAYNVEKYIDACLKSLKKQTYRELEILVIDDGSSDNTLEVANKCFTEDSRIKVIHKENGGVSSARNLALSLATGDYICFLDADDEMEPDAIEIMVRAIGESGADWVNCQYSRWDEDGKRLEDYNFLTGQYSLGTDEDKISFITQKWLNYLVGFEVWNKLYKTEIIKSNALDFCEKCKIGEDLAFNLKYLMHAEKLCCIEDRCIRYMIRGGSAMGALKELSRKIEEHILLLEDVRTHAEKSGRNIFSEDFLLVFVKVMDNAYIGHSPSEVLEAYKKVANVSFASMEYKHLSYKHDAIVKMYSNDIAEMKFRYHMYVKNALSGSSVFEKVFFAGYNLYRHLRRREPLCDWKMPY